MCQIHQIPDELKKEDDLLTQKWYEEGGDLKDIINKYGSSQYKKYIEDALKG